MSRRNTNPNNTNGSNSRSSTPSDQPPPFSITQTPFFERNSFLYKIHPRTLAEIHADSNMFDTASGNQTEGLLNPIPYKKITTPSGMTSHFSRKRKASPLSGQSPYQRKRKSKRQTPTVFSPSSPLLAPSPSPKPIQDFQIPIYHPPQPQPSFFANLYTKITEIDHLFGYPVTWILTLVIAWIAVTIYIFETTRTPPIIPLPIEPIEIIDPIDYHIPMPPSTYEPRVEDLNVQLLEQRVDSLTEVVNKIKLDNTALPYLEERIKYNEDNITVNKQNITDHATHIDGITTTIMDDVEPLINHHSQQTDFNWISRIYALPGDIIQNEDNINTVISNNNDNNDNEITYNPVTLIWVGINAWHESNKKYYGYTKDMNEQQKTDNMKQVLSNTNIASFATSDTLNPGDCLQFNKADNWIELELSNDIKATKLKYTHIKKELIEKEEYKYMSPKSFKIKGRRKNESEWRENNIETDNDIMGIDQSEIILPLDFGEEGIEIIRIEWEINPEATATRIYRMSVIGNIA